MANAGALMRLFNAGNTQRKVGGTKMNAESSRSHSVFSILLEVIVLFTYVAVGVQMRGNLQTGLLRL